MIETIYRPPVSQPLLNVCIETSETLDQLTELLSVVHSAATDSRKTESARLMHIERMTSIAIHLVHTANDLLTEELEQVTNHKPELSER